MCPRSWHENRLLIQKQESGKTVERMSRPLCRNCGVLGSRRLTLSLVLFTRSDNDTFSRRAVESPFRFSKEQYGFELSKTCVQILGVA
jgi:hypothetical protein